MKKNLFTRTLASILIAAGGLPTLTLAKTPNFDVNDVSWLFPFPSKTEDLDALISMETLKTEDGQLLWPMPAFESVLAIADSDDAEVEGVGRIKLPAEVRKMPVWKIAGVRFDPSAPGTSPEIIDKFGCEPQIRLILQPVTGTPPKPHDITIHVIYSFSSPEKGSVAQNTFPKADADEEAFLEIVKDLVAVQSLAEKLNANTKGKELGVHPALLASTASAEVRKAMRDTLIRHLPKGNLRAMAIMGLPNGLEPWIFVAIMRTPDGNFVAAPGFNTPSRQQKAQGLSFLPIGPKGVLPPPVTNNIAPIINQQFVSPELRRGVSTAALFKVDPNLAAKAEIASTGDDGKPVLDPTATNADIVDIIANPNRSHFFNTDCVSCHTETTRSVILKIKPGEFAFNKPIDLSNLSDAVTPKSIWNVRNFGWGPAGPIRAEPKATVSRRAFNETAESAEFINKNYLPRLVLANDKASTPPNQ